MSLATETTKKPEPTPLWMWLTLPLWMPVVLSALYLLFVLLLAGAGLKRRPYGLIRRRWGKQEYKHHPDTAPFLRSFVIIIDIINEFQIPVPPCISPYP
jgi:hypothetical protein